MLVRPPRCVLCGTPNPVQTPNTASPVAVATRMHRGVYAMGEDVIRLCEAQYEARQLKAAGEPLPAVLVSSLDGGSAKYVHFCMQFVHMLLHAQVRPYLVFDGAPLPAKEGTDEDRYSYVGLGLERRVAQGGAVARCTVGPPVPQDFSNLRAFPAPVFSRPPGGGLSWTVLPRSFLFVDLVMKRGCWDWSCFGRVNGQTVRATWACQGRDSCAESLSVRVVTPLPCSPTTAMSQFTKAIDVNPRMCFMLILVSGWWVVCAVSCGVVVLSRTKRFLLCFPCHLLWQRLRQLNLDYIVSPYESDAQLAYLCREGLVDAFITEDSDLIPYGAKRVRSPLTVAPRCPCRRRVHDCWHCTSCFGKLVMSVHDC